MSVGIATLGSFCYGIDFTKKVPIWVYGWITGTYTDNVLVEGRPISCQYDLTTASTGGVGMVMTMPRPITVTGRPIAAEFDWTVGWYQGFIISGATSVRTTY